MNKKKESNATFSIHSTAEESQTINRTAIKSKKKPVDRIEQPYEVTDNNTQKYKKIVSRSTIETGKIQRKPLANGIRLKGSPYLRNLAVNNARRPVLFVY